VEYDALLVHVGVEWQSREGQKMINRLASTLQVDYRLQCMTKCRLSPTCDSYNYRLSDKTCELNTHDTPLTVDSCVHAGVGLSFRQDVQPQHARHYTH